MLHKLFAHKKLSLLLNAGILINIIGLFLDIIIYHYYSNSNFLKIVALNLNNVSIFIICAIIISQTLLLFLKKHQKLMKLYPIATITIETCMAIFLFWMLTIENDIEGEFIIFYSSLSRLDHSYRIMFVIATITMLLIIDFYRSLEDQVVVNDRSVVKIVKESFYIVIRRHLLLLLFAFGIIHFTKIHKFAVTLLGYSKATLFFNLTLLEILIPISWIFAIGYYLYLTSTRKKLKKEL